MAKRQKRSQDIPAYWTMKGVVPSYIPRWDVFPVKEVELSGVSVGLPTYTDIGVICYIVENSALGARSPCNFLEII